jgi:hypothetical protein
MLLHHYMGEIDGAFRAWGFQKGGTGAISEAIASSARALGAEIRTNAPVDHVVVRDGRVRGVVLENGDEVAAPIVVSGLDPRRTFLQLVERKELPDDLVEEVERYKFRGSSGKVNLALSGLPEFTCLPGVGPHHRGAFSISPSVEYLERAYDDAKYGNFSRNPYMDIVFPSMIDPGMAPPGKHVMSIFVQYAPYNLTGGWDDAKREAFGDAVIKTVARYAPNIESLILHRQVLTPADIERITGLSEGNIFQGELSLEQLFFLRPVAGWARFRDRRLLETAPAHIRRRHHGRVGPARRDADRLVTSNGRSTATPGSTPSSSARVQWPFVAGGARQAGDACSWSSAEEIGGSANAWSSPPVSRSAVRRHGLACRRSRGALLPGWCDDGKRSAPARSRPARRLRRARWQVRSSTRAARPRAAGEAPTREARGLPRSALPTPATRRRRGDVFWRARPAAVSRAQVPRARSRRHARVAARDADVASGFARRLVREPDPEGGNRRQWRSRHTARAAFRGYVVRAPASSCWRSRRARATVVA